MSGEFMAYRQFLLPIIYGTAMLGCSEQNIAKTGSVEDTTEEAADTSPFSTDWGQWLSMAVLPDDRPIITFYDRDQGGIGFAIGTMTGSAVTWSFEGVDGYPDSSGLDAGDRGLYTSVVAAPDGTVWASFYDKGAKNLRYAKRHPTLGAWSAGIADLCEGASPNAGWFSSIALDGQGNPVIAHHDHTKGTLRVARWNGINFVGSVFDRGEAFTADTGTDEEDTEANVGQFVQLQIVDGTEYMAYYDAANGDLKLAIGTDIHIVDAGGDVGTWPNFEIRDGTFHIMYQDKGNQMLKYAKGTPGDWTITVVDKAPYTGADTALYFDGSTPKVVYFEGRSNNMKKAWVESGDGSETTNWENSVIASEGAVGFHNEVATIGGKPFVACYDFTVRNVYFAELD
jgi:hypothetical protein